MTSELAKRLGVEQQFTEGRTQEEWMRHLHELSRKAILTCRISIPSASRASINSAIRKGTTWRTKPSATIRRRIR